jgi:EAL domain-containing protein (putative c-di-GMP-specific phosphodiesterase class I)
VAVVLGECNLPPENLILEVTEGVLMRETELTLRGLRRLKELGVGIAIDDFGTGYSSLGYLRRFPIDVIKIDKSLIDGVGEGADASAIVEAIVKMSHSLGLLTCAEGIESEAQVSELNAIGCALGQGYHYARPLEANGIVSLLRQHQVSRAHAGAPLGLISLGHPRSSRRDPL